LKVKYRECHISHQALYYQFFVFQGLWNLTLNYFKRILNVNVSPEPTSKIWKHKQGELLDVRHLKMYHHLENLYINFLKYSYLRNLLSEKSGVNFRVSNSSLGVIW